MQPQLILLPLLATFLSLVSGLPLPLKQRDDDLDAGVTGPLGLLRVGATGTLAVRNAEPPSAEDV
jgi:hypothetical protein